MRNERYRKNAISVRERHNERKNEVYSNPDVLLEYSRNNVTFKACEAATYAQQFDRMVEEGVVSTRGLKPDAYVFDELVFDVNTDYFETHGGYEYGWQFCGGNDYAPRVVHGVVFPAVGCHGIPLPAGTHGVFLDAERLDFAGKLCGGLAGMPTLRQ